MEKHLIVYIHGVNTRSKRYEKNYASDLDQSIFWHVKKQAKAKQRHIELLQSAPLFWAEVNQAEEDALLSDIKLTRAWGDFHLKHFREMQVFQFVGDAALYISRKIGSKVVEALHAQLDATIKLNNLAKGSNAVIHLVAHSWGTIMLFDILFAKRWDDLSLPEDIRNKVAEIRNIFFGLGTEADVGMRVGSINTMGSPLALFSLMNKEQDGTHSISENFGKMINTLSQSLNGKPLEWNNFIHPGDLIGWPLQTVLQKILQEPTPIDIQDWSTESLAPDWEVSGIVWSGQAHGSYWTSEVVAKEIAGTIVRASTS